MTKNPRKLPELAPRKASPATPIWIWPTVGISLVLLFGIVVYAVTGGFSSRSARRISRTALTDQGADGLPAPKKVAPGPAPDGMVWIPGGKFWMGSEQEDSRDARPVHEVTLDGFWMDRTEVTNRQFAQFVSATGYRTVAERKPQAKDYPGVPEEKLVAGSIVFSPPSGAVSLDQPLSWWEYVAGADWKHPEGPKSGIEGRDDHPVVHICWEDAAQYAHWAGKRLPTEAEWEYSARGSLDRAAYCWGNELRPDGKWMVNNWQGDFPKQNTQEDRYARTAPVGSFPPNGYGLYDMAGNVWEWCADWYLPGYDDSGSNRNPQGPTSSHDPNEPGSIKRVQRGGSFLCADSYCRRYRPDARGKGAPDSAAPHVGFRCVQSPARATP